MNPYTKRSVSFIDKDKMCQVAQVLKNRKFKLRDGGTLSYVTKGTNGTIFKLIDSKGNAIIIKEVPNNTISINEYKLLEMMSEEVKSKTCPHFIVAYGYCVVQSSFYLFMEKMDGTLRDWIYRTHTVAEWKSVLFQFLIGVYCMHKYGKIYHSDLAESNIFYLKLTEDTKCYFKYVIEEIGATFICPHQNWLIAISDFDKSQSAILAKSADKKMITEEIKKLSDLQIFSTLLKRFIVDYLLKQIGIDKMIEVMKKSGDSDFFEYYEYKKSKVAGYKLDEKGKKNVLKKAVAHYFIDHGYYKGNMSKVPNLPPQSIVALIEEISNTYENKDLLSIIQEHFGEFLEQKSINTENVLDTFWC